MSFIDELTELGAKILKEGEIGYDDTEKLKKKLKSKWEEYGGGKEQARKKCTEREFFLYWKFTLDQSYDPCRPTVEQVREALPDELKNINKSNEYDTVNISANTARQPIEYTVCYNYESKVNNLVEKEEKDAKKKREREEGNEGDAKKVKTEANEEAKAEEEDDPQGCLAAGFVRVDPKVKEEAAPAAPPPLTRCPTVAA